MVILEESPPPIDLDALERRVDPHAYADLTELEGSALAKLRRRLTEP
ncbi:MAG: hypothetical protein WD271_00315 [Acidimicrobiia bacterium]